MSKSVTIIASVIWTAAWLVLHAGPAFAEDQAQPADPAAARLVVQLGDDSFSARQQAERELSTVGFQGRDVLLAGLQHEDAEIRRACRRILTGVLEADFQRRSQAFLADKEGKQDHTLPGWDRYRQIAGNDKEARQLFVQMLQAEPGLIESVESRAVDAVTLRLMEVNQMLHNRNTRQRKPPSRGTMAALLFACSDAGLDVPDDVMTRSNLHSLLAQGDFGVSLQKGPHRDASRALLGEWIMLPTSPKMAQQKLRFAVMYDVKEPGLDLALHTLKERKGAAAAIVASAIEAVGRLGGKPYAALLADLLGDEGVAAQRTVMKGKERIRSSIEVRDVALAWLVFLTDQDHKTYSQKQAKSYFDMVKRYPNQAFNFANFYYESPAERDSALAKWDVWVKDHPLPTPPRTVPREIPTPQTPKPGAVVAAPDTRPVRTDGTSLAVRRLEMADRLQVRELKRAQKLIEQGEFVEATTILGRVLAADGDYFYRPGPTTPLFKQLKAEAEQVLGRLPRAGRDVYELQFAPQARLRLDRAVKAADMPAVAQVERSFFYTPAGAEATFLLATHHRLGGRFTQAAMYFERLQKLSPWVDRFQPSLSLQQAFCWHRAGFPDKARTLLNQLLDSDPAAAAAVAGQAPATLAELEQAMFGPGLDAATAGIGRSEWVVFRGALNGNEIVRAGNPYLVANFAEAVASDGYVADAVGQVAQDRVADRRTALPTTQPLVVDGAIIYRTPLAIRAVDLATGELRWESTSLNALWHLTRFGNAADKKGQRSYVVDGLRRRLSEDPSFGTLSSSGHLAFAVEDVGFALGPEYRPAMVRPDGQRQMDTGALSGFNRLAAYDVRSGKLMWEVGGPPNVRDAPLAGGRFTGPPLPLGDQLYAVVEFEDQTLLVALDAASGGLQQQWLLDTQDEYETPLAAKSLGQAQQPRLTRGVSPVFGGGLLICRTAGNRYAAVDLASRAVRWSYEPPAREVPGRANLVAMRRLGMLQQLDADATNRWCDAGATVAGERVLLTPLDSDEIFCLNLADGDLLWSAAREDGLYLAGAHAAMALVVGRETVRALTLQDGTPAWSAAVALPRGSAPSGRGYLADDRLYVPLTSAQVVAIDLASGRIVSKSLSPDSAVPENLVKVGDVVVSAGLQGLQKFETLTARARRLATAVGVADDSRSAIERAEILLYEGQVMEALDLLRQVQQSAPSPRAVTLLAEATLQALRAGVPDAQTFATDLVQSLDDPEVRGRLLEELATTYYETGLPEAAFDCCLKLIDSGASGEQLIDVTAAHTVRRSRYIQNLVAMLVESAGSEMRASFEAEIRQRLEGDLAQAALPYFDFHPLAHAARLGVAGELAGEGRRLEAELMLRRVLRSGQLDQRASATARLAELLRASGKTIEAARFYAQLAGPWEQTPCLGGKTGQQIVAALPADDPVRQLVDRPDPWPVSGVETKVERREPSKAKSLAYSMPLPVTSDGGPLSPDIFVNIDVQKRKLRGHDAQGARQWETDLTADKTMSGYLLQNYLLNDGRLTGHLLLVWSVQKVAAIDTLGEGKVLWTRDVTKLNAQNMWMVPFFRLRLQLGMQGQVAHSELSQPLVVTPTYVAFQQDRILVALDPVSGDTLWIRDDFPSGSDLFGDERRLLITPPDREEAVVLSAIDGHTLGTRRVPDRKNRVATLGQGVVTWEASDGQAELKSFDPWQQKVLWQREFAPTAKTWLIGASEIGVLDAEGRFTVLALETGEPVIQTTVAPQADLDSIFVMRNDRRYVLVANGPEPEQKGPTSFNRIPPGTVRVDGRVFGLDARNGAQLWSAEIKNQWLTANLPCAAPVLVFFKKYQKPIKMGNNAWRSDSPSVFLDCLDSRTGQRLHSSKIEKTYEQSYVFEVSPAERRVRVETRLETIDFTFPEAEPKAG